MKQKTTVSEMRKKLLAKVDDLKYKNRQLIKLINIKYQSN